MQKLFQKTINPEATEKKTGKSDYMKLKNLWMVSKSHKTSKGQ